MMVRIPAGDFVMGSDTGAPWERPAHVVYVDVFAIAATTVIRREYAEFLAATGHRAPEGWSLPEFAEPCQPVVGVNWFDAVAYCEWLSRRDGLSYRLPTEAEWEKACRGGLEGTTYSWGNTPPQEIEYYATEWNGPRTVAERAANGYGLFNIGDNVHEWCMDWYDAGYYAQAPSTNPAGPEEGTRRVSRGGSWRHRVKASRNAHRSSLPPQYRYTDYGFRVVQELGNPSRAI